MKYFETHCHLDFPNFGKDREQVINSCIKSGVEYFVNIGIDKTTSEASLALADKYEQFFAAAGYHPAEADSYDEETLRKLLKHPKIVAIGEIGLDYYRNHHPRSLQKKVFEQQILLGKELAIPLIIHDRDAHEDCLKLLDKHHPDSVVFHCFSGDAAFAEEIWERNWFISFTAAITYPNSKMNDVIRIAPSEKIMIETDCPFLAPQAIRGKRNDPTSLRYVVEKIAEIKRIPPKIVAETVFTNACNFFLRKNL
jgi:TatD DNase family protein